MKRLTGTSGLALALAISGFAQSPPPPAGPLPQAPPQGQEPAPPPPPRDGGGRGIGRGMGRGSGPGQPSPFAARAPIERGLQVGPGGRWWNNPDMVQKLNLNSDQQKKMDDIFQQNRLKLIDLNATLQKDEITLEPLMASESPDEAKILAQIDRVAQARAELEKANARFLLGIRRVLTQEQWKKLQAEHMNPGRGPGGPPRPARPARGE
jgi:Spy/CpxP family protein refolding chaperone